VRVEQRSVTRRVIYGLRCLVSESCQRACRASQVQVKSCLYPGAWQAVQ
jgi:hypothetical protein